MDNIEMPAAVILAGGLSRRLGRPKQLLKGGGRLLLVQVLEAVFTAGLFPIILVLGHKADDVLDALKSEDGLPADKLLRIKIIINEDYKTGQASAVKKGIESLPPETRAAQFIMGDQADLDPRILRRIAQAHIVRGDRRVIRPLFGGVPGGPMLWPRRFFPDLMELKGDAGGRRLFKRLASEDIHDLEFEAKERPLDIDTESDYRIWLDQLSKAESE